MEKLTRKQKLKLVRKARKNYINLVKRGDPLGLCFSLNQAYIEIWGEDVGYTQIREDILPEMVKHKPEGVDVKDSWWKYSQTEVRVDVLNKLEYEFLPWYLKIIVQAKKPIQMRKQLTPTEKLNVIRKARDMHMSGDFHFLCSTVLHAIVSVIGARVIVRYEDLPETMPELYEYKPSHKDKGDAWWPADVTEPRLAVLDNLEARYYAQTTWLSRMWFKIKNTRTWKS